MKFYPHLSCFLVIALAGFGGCSKQPATGSKKAQVTLDKIQGKTQILLSESSAADAALNAGGQTVYLIDGVRHYRLFFKSPTTVEPGKEYVAEGVYAQKMIDEIGDPDQGKHGYPLQESCDRVVRTAWPGLAFDVTDQHISVLRARVQRYPARPLFLVNKLTPVTATDDAAAKKAAAEKDAPEITVPAEKQKALLTSGPATLTAPLWEPAGETVSCKVVIDTEGKIAALDTGIQLCEAVPWSEFRYQPTLQNGKAVKVRTEVEIRYDPRK